MAVRLIVVGFLVWHGTTAEKLHSDQLKYATGFCLRSCNVSSEKLIIIGFRMLPQNNDFCSRKSQDEIYVKKSVYIEPFWHATYN